VTECTRCRRQYQEGVRFCPVDGFAAVPVSDPYVGRQLLGQFQLLAACGRGATGTVYRAQQTSMDRLVAVKIMRADLLSDPTVVKRFIREARAGARLCHPNIATVHLVGQTEEGLPYIVMEYIEGTPLSSAVNGHDQVPMPLPAARILHIAEQIASALAEAHDRGIVHRDLKPENILLTERRGESDIVKVVDFGIAKIVADTMSGDSQISRIGTIFGTPHYIAPEQASGGEVDARADLYALGCILFQMATGRVPFEGASGIQVLLRHLREEPPHPRALNPHLPEPLAHLILRLLAKRREDRPADADAVLVEIRNLREALRGLPQPPALSTAEVVFRGFADVGSPPPAASAEHAALPASPRSSAAVAAVAAPVATAAAPAAPVTSAPVAAAAPAPATPTPTPAPAPITPAPTPVIRQAAQDDAAEDLEAALPWWRRGRRWGALVGGAVVLGLVIGGAMAWRVRQGGLAARKGEPAPVTAPVEATPALQAPEKLPVQRTVVQPGQGKRGAKVARKRQAEEMEPDDALLPEVHFPAQGSPVSVSPGAAPQAPTGLGATPPAALVPPVVRPAAPQPVTQPPAALPTPPTAPYPVVQPETRPAPPPASPAPATGPGPGSSAGTPPAPSPRPAPPPPPSPAGDDKIDPTTDPYYNLK
jgi:serine/threonine-protein kinase